MTEKKLPWENGGRNKVAIEADTGKVVGPIVKDKSKPGQPVWVSDEGTERTGVVGYSTTEARLVEANQRRIEEEGKKKGK